MAQAQIEERKRSLIEQALNASIVEVDKKKRRMKEEKQESNVEKKAKSKRRPQKPKLKAETKKKGEQVKPKSKVRPILPKVCAGDTVELTTEETTLNDPVAEYQWIGAVGREEEEEENDFKIYEWVECPDGIPGCEVLHGVRRENEVMPRATEPKEIQSHDVIMQRGKLSVIQCYWSIIVDVVCIALVQYCKESCEGCKTESRKKHELCELPVKVVWAENRIAILGRVNLSSMMGRWTSAIHSSCGVWPSEVERLFDLFNPAEMIGRWLLDGSHIGLVCDDTTQWKKELNTRARMAKIEHPASHCSFDEALIPVLQGLKCRNN